MTNPPAETLQLATHPASSCTRRPQLGTLADRA